MTESNRRPRTRAARLLGALAITLSLAACADQGGGTASGASSAAPGATAAAAAPSAAAQAEPGCKHGDQGECGSCEHAGESGSCGKHGEREHAGCGDEPSTDGVSDEVREKVDASGRKLTVVGAELGSAPTLTVEQALAKPTAELDKPIQVEGNVTAMCQGKRAWFAVVGDDRSGEPLRVITAPAFLVPLGSIGRRARVEGRLAEVQISAGTAKHYADDHKLPKAGDGSGPVTQIVLRAVGAEFYDP